ncbi:tail fiber assembly protein [Escherichia coli]|uniref:tail fiber assembly protein n=1 Tax=Enterobacteriaceae TaxID=543 RepID=UPI0017BBD27E|nr:MULTISPECIES: tail fiber assembly protein [Enterobacteriaceae]EFH8489284.1 tail fiber assembly protein [Escherichia coli]EHZ4787918.1 tail fiber assembly protein [Escherichia coli]EIH6840516.1 tail fiber assembly protein [Escherichia coli]EIH7565817.1 tail fiber assembly protein [Escherichia coli]EJD4605964.1 tail fiber assembly protein [Escherichia coli]
MTFKMADIDRIITIYNLSSATNEFIGKGDGFIPANTGLPAYSTNIAPPSAKAGFVAVFNFESEKWSLVEDHRGKIVYDIQTGKATTIDQLGKLPDDVVSVAPEGHFVKWDGAKWVHDTDAENEHLLMLAEQEKINLLAVATSAIAPLQDAVDLDMATEVETALLLEWKKYRVLLNRVDTSKPEWPTPPNIQAS